MLTNARLSAVSLKEGAIEQTAYVVEATRGAASIEEVDAMEYYDLEKLLGGEQSLLAGLAFAREVEQLKGEEVSWDTQRALRSPR